MRIRHLAFTLAISLAATAATAQQAPSPAAPAATGSAAAKKTCPNGQLGGIVKSNKKVGGEYVTAIRGDKQVLRTPQNAGETYVTVSKLKPGDLYCYADEGS